MALRCCFHDGDRRPSLYINLHTGVWICHAGCGRGTWLDFLSRVNATLEYQPVTAVQAEPAASAFNITGLEPLLERGFTPGVLAEWCVFWDADTRAIQIPVHRPDGSYLAPIWRTVRPGNGPKYLHPEGFPRKEVLFGAHTPLVQAARYVTIVEGPLDAIWCQAAGVPGVAILGSFLNDEQADGLAEMGKHRAVLCFDNDAAGLEGGKQSYPKLQARGLWVQRVWLPQDVKDIQELPLERVPQVVKQAEMAVNGTGFANHRLRRFVTGSPTPQTQQFSPYRW